MAARIPGLLFSPWYFVPIYLPVVLALFEVATGPDNIPVIVIGGAYSVLVVCTAITMMILRIRLGRIRIADLPPIVPTLHKVGFIAAIIALTLLLFELPAIGAQSERVSAWVRDNPLTSGAIISVIAGVISNFLYDLMRRKATASSKNDARSTIR
jgi:hypothetical protein